MKRPCLAELCSPLAGRRKATKPQWRRLRAYDRWANLLTETPTAGSPPGLSIQLNGYNQFNSPGFSYDAAGHMTADGAGNTYAWDAEGRLTSVSNLGITNTYNAFGQRVYRTKGSSSVSYWQDVSGQFIGGYWGREN